MLNSGKKIALCRTKKKYSNSCVGRKNNSERNKKPYSPPPPPLQVKWSVPNSYSFLNYDLSKVNIVNDAACSCGAPREDAFHYFLPVLIILK